MWTLLAALLLGLLAILAVQHRVEPILEERARLATGDPAAALRELTLLWYGAFAGPVLLLVGIGAWSAWLSRSVLREDRFPPRGMKLLRPVPVRRGEEARRRGRWLATGAAVAVLAALGLLALAARLHRLLVLEAVSPG